MRLRAVALLILLTSAVIMGALPTASSAGSPFRTADLHVGDRLLYATEAEESSVDGNGAAVDFYPRDILWQGNVETLVTVEGLVEVVDGFGLSRQAVGFTIERAVEDEIVSVERCAMDPPLGFATRVDQVAGGPLYVNEWQFRGDDPLFGAATRYYNTTPLTTFRTTPCEGYWNSQRHDLRAGDATNAYWLVDDLATMPSMRYSDESTPATLTTWRGVEALRYDFTIGQNERSSGEVAGRGSIVFARGFPGAVLIEIEQVIKYADLTITQRGTRELVGYAPGSERFPFNLPYLLPPERNPNVDFVAYDGATPPTAALDLEYPFTAALVQMRSDPALGLDEYLRANPNAAVTTATYESERRPPAQRLGPFGVPIVASGELTGPGWVVCFAAQSGGFCAESVILREAPLRAFHQRIEEWESDEPVMTPYTAISPEAVATLFGQAGIAPGTLESLFYRAWPDGQGGVSLYLRGSQVGWTSRDEDNGLLASIGLDSGDIREVSSANAQVASSGLLSASSPPRELRPAAVPASWDDIRLSQWATAAAAATGAALLIALLAKLVLIPMYTRLQRDRLLDNPVRAMLFERIRADPGIHLAEIEEFLGIGKGATRHHVDQLVKHRFVFLVEEGGYTRAYVAGHIPPGVARRTALLRAGSHQRVYEVYAASPELPLREAARRLGMSAPSVHRAKKKLEAAGLLPADTPVSVTRAEA